MRLNMSAEKIYKQVNISIDPVRYYLLWMKETLLKIISFGLYAPWANQSMDNYLLSNTRFNDDFFKRSRNASNIFKARLLFIMGLLLAALLVQKSPMLSWAVQLLVLISLPGFYLIEKKIQLNAISLGDDVISFKLSLVDFYKSITLPILLFLISTLVIFNNKIIDSQFLDSIDTKEAPAIYAENSYLALAEKETQEYVDNKPHEKSYKELIHTDHTAEHAAEHPAGIEQWNENITEEEKDYLGEHEKSHNHGSISLSSLQKYQVTNQGNQFIQYVLTFIFLCLLWPWLDYKMMEYRITNTTFMGSDWKIKLGIVSLYKRYVKVFLLVSAMMAIVGLLLLTFLSGSEGSSPEFWSNLLANSLWLFPLVLAVLVFAFSLLFTWRKQWLLSNLVGINAAGEDVKTKDESQYIYTLYLAATNTLAVLFTLGLALPWCRIRTVRYLSNHFSIII
jgi:uncharacterized membrane protein YjgN (DUF898 family)